MHICLCLSVCSVFCSCVCGFRLDAELMESTVWSWAVDRPEAGFALPRAAVVSAVDGRWTDTDSDWEERETHSFACREPGARGTFFFCCC